MGLTASKKLHQNSKGTDSELDALRLLDKSWFLDVNYRSKNGNSNLHWACYTGKIKLVQSLLEKGAKCNVLNNDGATPLMVAIRYNLFDVVQALVESKVDVNFLTPSGGNALTLAVSCNHLDICISLLNANADIQTCALTKCAYLRESRDVAKLLLERGADPNSTENQKGDEERAPLTALMTAVFFRNMPIIELLTEQSKLNINEKNGDGYTALDCAQSIGEKKIIDHLISKGANTKVTELDEGYLRMWSGKLAKEVVQPLRQESDVGVFIESELNGKSQKRSREASQDVSSEQPKKRARPSSILTSPTPKQRPSPTNPPLVELG